MKIILICGDPAVGKLSVAQELAELTHFELFHNHETLDLAEKTLEWGTRDFWKFVMKERLRIVSDAAHKGTEGIILTYVYEGTENDDAYIMGLEKIASQTNSHMYCTQLFCDLDELKKRVVSESRKQFKKIQSIDQLAHHLSKSKGTGILKYDLRIDNTHLSPVEVANQIKLNFSL